MTEADWGGEAAAASIEALEGRIEALGDTIERCRKAMVLSRAAIWLGGGMIALAVLVAEARSVVVMLLGISAVIGGFTWLGANKSSREEAEAALREAEARRDQLIEGVPMRDVVVPFRLP
jgi:plasmid stabilization system protein ParE